VLAQEISSSQFPVHTATIGFSQKKKFADESIDQREHSAARQGFSRHRGRKCPKMPYFS
jgi:hypothetical protein